MATQTVYATGGIAAGSAVGVSGNAYGPPDGTFTTNSNGSAWGHRWTFTPPSGIDLAGTQVVNIHARKSGSGGTTPTLNSIRVFKDGVQVTAPTPNPTSITSYPAAQIVTISFPGSLIEGATEVGIEILDTGASGNPNNRRSIQIDAIEWVANGNSQEPDVPNVPPVAVAGNDMTVEVGKVFTLDGSASYDPDGSITNYRWYEDAGGLPVLYGNGPDPVAMTYIGNERTAVFYLTVTDNDGATSTDSVAVTAVAANQPPVANAGPDGQGIKGGQYTLDGSASYDLDGTIVDYEWALIDIVNGSVTIPGTGPTRTVTLPDRNANYILTVTDDQGATDTDAVTITLSDPPSQTTQWYIVESGVEVPILFEGIVEAGSISAGTLAPASDPTLPPTDGGGEIITPVNPGGVT